MRTNQEIARMFLDIADAMEVLGENRFRLSAYRRAGELIASLTSNLATLRTEQDLTELPHIGVASAQMINDALDQGYSPLYEAMLTRVPPGVLEMLRVPGVGPKSAARLYHEFAISDRAALYAAAREGRLREIKGFGAKTESRIIASIEQILQHSQRLRLVDALRVMDELVAVIGGAAGIAQISPAGSVRRGQSTVGDLDLVAAADNLTQARQTLLALPQVAQGAETDHGVRLALHNGMQVTVALCQPADWGGTLLLWTGNALHRTALLERAAAREIALERGFATEAAAYAALELPWITPELREGWGEIAAAEAGLLPTLIEASDIRADLHWHTQWSDGRDTLEAMVSAGRALGYTHMAVADHSAYLGVTGGLDGRRLREQRSAIDALNAANPGFRLLQCCEVDILPDGTLALPDDVLAELDLVVASPHVALRQERATATARLVRAIENPHVDIIGHPTGRLLEERAGADLDMREVIAAAVATDTALEVNAGPERLDLDAPLVRQALQAGARISINTDAHDPRHLAGIGLGVITARRGGAQAADVINTWALDALITWTQRNT